MTKRTQRPNNGISYIIFGVSMGLALFFYVLWSNLTAKPDGNTAPPAQAQASASVPNNSGNLPASPGMLAERKTRIARAGTWIASADAVATKTNDTHAADVIKYLKQHAGVAEPAGYGKRTIEPAASMEDRLSLVPLGPGDSIEGAVWRDRLIGRKNTFAALYDADIASIVLVPDDLSPTWQGIHLLHAGHHALTYSKQPYIHEREAFCRQEMDAYTFQNRLLLMLGGEAYRRALDNEVARLMQLAKLMRQENPRDKEVPNPSLHYPELEQIFGPSNSGLERHLRDLSFWLHAAIVFNQKMEGDAADTRNSELLCTVFKDEGAFH